MLRIAVAAAAYAITLGIAALIMGDNFDIDAGPFIIAVAIFTAAIVLLKPVVAKFAGKYVHSATWVAGLITVFLALLITNVLTGDGFTIDGFIGWVLATVIVWVGTLVYDVVDDRAIAAVERGVNRLDDQF